MIKITMSLILIVLMNINAQEVIEITGELSEYTQKYIWPSLANGGVIVKEGKIYIPTENEIYIQSRSSAEQSAKISIDLDKHNNFTLHELLIQNESIFVNLLYTNGMFYIYRKDLREDDGCKIILKHGYPDRMVGMPRGRLLSTGFYRPEYSTYLEKYDDETVRGGTELSRRMFNELYEKHPAFSLALYDSSLSLVDSANVLERTGENARAFESLFVKHPIDLLERGVVAIIDNSEGYTIELYDRDLKLLRKISLANSEFKRIPDNLTLKSASTLKQEGGKHSIAYALYVKRGKIITSFYHAAKTRERPKAPYFYDITSLDGERIASGTLDFPIVSEDDKDKVFLFVRKPGGWFEDDGLYLVGVTLEDIISGKAEKSKIEAAIAKHEAGD